MTVAALTDERLAALALQNIPGIGPTYAKRLIESTGSFVKVFEDGLRTVSRAEEDVDTSLRIPAAYLERIKTHKDQAFDLAERQLRQAEAAGLKVIILTQPEYPARLKEIPDPPAALYIYGEAEPADELSLGVVGTRKATETGLKFAKEISYELASAGINVVSGLALGVDAAAHKGAMEAEGGRTWAVLGTGADVCYPPRNRNIYDMIIKDRRGVIVSEFPPGAEPEAYHFPLRNRIISGLTLGVVVIEAPERSGALITARMAVEQGRDVFAVPHPARSVAGAGTNRLIREGAHLIEKVEDILSVIEHEARRIIGRSPSSRHAAPPSAAVADSSSRIFELIQTGVSGLDELVVRSGQGVSAVLAELTRLEIDGRIRRAAASTYQPVHPRR